MLSTVTSTASATTGGRTVLDCSVLQANERFEAWAEAVSESFVPLAAKMKSREMASGFQGHLISQSVGQAEIYTVAGSAMSVRRTARSIAQNDPGFIKLGLQLRGYSVISQDGRDAALAPGDFAIYDTTRPYLLDFGESFEMFVVMFPAQLLRFDRRTLATLTASRFSGRRGLGAVTSSFLGEISRQLDAEPLSGGVPLSDAVFDLLSATFAERLGPLATSDDAARRRALTMQLESYIAAHLGDPGLTVASIAAFHNVSVRYLQKLFEQQHETVSGWIRHRRLEQARRDLANPNLADRSVASVGASWGFMDAAGFARAFRSTFGMTPSDFRGAALRPLESA